MEHCTSLIGRLGQLNIPKIRNSVLTACLVALKERRDFVYTDILVQPYGHKKVYQTGAEA